MTKTEFRLGVLAIFAAILLHNLTSPDRYTVTQTSGSTALRTDGITGMTWKLQSARWLPVVLADWSDKEKKEYQERLNN
jgi:hypothetical protein|tara:strand:+ start:102 stop:338 length:237 start_codon:yes stop_codon:yes gene_type:complete